MEVVIAYLIIINVIAFLVMFLDKSLARSGRFRIPERVLMFLAVIGGSVGAILGMVVCRHKIRKPLFLLGFPSILALHVIVAIYFMRMRGTM